MRYDPNPPVIDNLFQATHECAASSLIPARRGRWLGLHTCRSLGKFLNGSFIDIACAMRII